MASLVGRRLYINLLGSARWKVRKYTSFVPAASLCTVVWLFEHPNSFALMSGGSFRCPCQ